jgi:hypothetical protein
MGIHNNALIGGSGQGGYFINNSLRLRSSASAYLNRTSGTPTSGSIFTHSFWIKRGTLGAQQSLIAGQRPTNFDRIYFESDNTLFYQWNDGTSNLAYVQTTQVFRDPSAWYHIVVSTDTTQATASNRVKIYINGVQVTALTSTTYPTQNSTSYFNTNAVTLNIGRSTNAAMYFDGYMGEINFIDGQALTPSSFGQTDTLTGQWVPKKYTGTYGTNGFYLKFADTSDNTAATIGKDSSGNGNNWTPNNISKTAGATYDFMTDSPTVGPLASNYAVMSPLIRQGNSSTDFTSDGNLKYTVGSNGGYTSSTFATIPMTSGKWYAEVYINAAVTAQWVGVSSDVPKAGLGTYGSGGTRNPGYAYKVNTGNKCNNDNTGTAYAASSTTGDTIGIAMDADAGSITFYKNGTSLGVAYTGMTNTGNGWLFGSDSDPNGSFHWNFGQRPFSYTQPTGYSALNTYNLPAPAIKNGALNMTTALWTANVANPTAGQKSIALGFQPDLVWSKNRSDAEHHYWVDSVRGDNSGSKWLKSNATAAEGADAVGSTTAKYVFSSTGFDIVDTDSNAGEVYYSTSSRTYVGWAWKAGGGTAVTNTSGTISSQVSANPTAGFSIVLYTGNGTAGATVGHGLGVTPNIIIAKSRSAIGSWPTFTTPTGNSATLLLDTTDAAGNYQGAGYPRNPNSTTFELWFNSGGANINANAVTYVAYCFAAVAGYSAFGIYTANGATDGPFLYLGFRPRFIMLKRSTSAGAPWTMIDTSRSPYNAATLELDAHATTAEYAAGNGMDILSNGIKLRASDYFNSGGGDTFIYMAFAENPFKYANAR